MLNLKSNVLSIGTFLGTATLTLGTAFPAQAVLLGIPSQDGAANGGVGFVTNGNGGVTFLANNLTTPAFAAGSFDSNGGGFGGNYINNNFVNFVDNATGTGAVRSGSGGGAFVANPLALSLNFDYKATAATPFGLSTNGTSITTLLATLGISGLGAAPSPFSLILDATQRGLLTAGTTFLFDPAATQTLQFSNFRFDVTPNPVPFEFNPIMGGVFIAGLVGAKKLQKKAAKKSKLIAKV
jgi:hypothetical protein